MYYSLIWVKNEGFAILYFFHRFWRALIPRLILGGVPAGRGGCFCAFVFVWFGLIIFFRREASLQPR